MAVSKLIKTMNGAPFVGSIYYVVGTQSTDTGSWTGVLPISGLYDGLTIVYYLPRATSGNVTLNLTLSDGTTTGAKDVYLSQDSRLTTQFAKGSSISLVYRTSRINTSGTTITNSWVHPADYDTVNNYELRNGNAIKAAAAITASTIIVGSSSGYKTVTSGVTFDVQYPILWARDTIASAGTSDQTFHRRSYVNFATTKPNWTGTANSMVFIVATLSGTTATIDSSVFTTTVPSSADSKVYIPIGLLQTTTTGYFCPSGMIFAYRNGHFGPLEPDLSNFAAASSTVTKVSSSTDNAVVRFDGTEGAIQNSSVTIDDNGYLSAGRILLNATADYAYDPLRIGDSRLGQRIGDKILYISGAQGIFLGVTYTNITLGYKFTSSYIGATFSTATVGRQYQSGNSTILDQFAAMYAKDFVENGEKLSDIYAKLASPAFTGTPTAPTAAVGTDSTQIATTAFVKEAIDNLNLSANFAPISSTGYVPFANASNDVTSIRNLTITGNLTVQGTTTTVNSTSIEVSDALITLAKGNTSSLTQFAGFVVPKYDGTNNGALVFDNTGTAYVGDATLTASGTITAQGDMKPLTTRYGSFTNGNIVVWDSETSSIKDSGKKVSDFATSSGVTSISAGSGLTTDQTNSGAITGTGTISLSDTGVTIGSYGPSSNSTLTHSGTFSVPYITVDEKGRITSASTKTLTLPASENTDTKVNMTLGTTTKAYLLASATAPTSTAQAVSAIADTGVYLDTTAGRLCATSFVENGTTLSEKYYAADNPNGYTTNEGNVTGSSLTKGYFVLGNDGAAISISSLKPTTSTTSWNGSSDVNVPTMKSISSYTSNTYAVKAVEMTTFSWTDGTSAGPTGLLTNGKETTASDYKSVSFGAIPAASGDVSGIVTTGAQVFAGVKGFNAKYLYIFGGTSASDPSFLRVEYRTGTASTSYGALMSVGGSTLKLGLNNASAINSGNYTWNAPTKFLTIDTAGNVAADGYIQGNSIIKTGGTASQILLADGSTMVKADWVEYVDLTTAS